MILLGNFYRKVYVIIVWPTEYIGRGLLEIVPIGLSSSSGKSTQLEF